MSDALTDISRDQDRSGLLSRIGRIETEFLKSPDKDKAKELMSFWAEYADMPRGYWGSSNETFAYERIGMYDTYLKTGQIPDFLTVNNQKIIRIGNGFIVDGIEKDVLCHLSKIYGDINHRNFQFTLTIEEITEVSCGECLYFCKMCGKNYYCKSKNLDELKKRKELTEIGKGLLREIRPGL